MKARVRLVGSILALVSLAASVAPLPAGATSPGLHAFYAFDDGLEGWTATGTDGTVSAIRVPGRPGSAFLEVASTAAGFKAVSPVLSLGDGERLVLQFRRPQPTNLPIVVARGVTADGAEVFKVWMEMLQVRASNGTGPYQPFASSVGSAWHRLDVALSGSAYVATMDRTESWVLARSSTAAVARIQTEPSAGLAVEIDDVRVVSGDLPDQNFRTSIDGHGWTGATEGAGALWLIPTGNWGLHDLGLLQVDGSSSGRAYVAASTSGLGDRYLVRSAVLAETPRAFPGFLGLDASPDHVAVVAGLDADGDLVWALTMGPWIAQRIDGQALFLLRPGDVVPTRLSDAFASHEWHTVWALADVDTGTVEVFLDESSLGTVEVPLTGIATIAAGDVFDGDGVLAPSGAGRAFLDAISAMPYAGGL
ncbi:MAG: hypothetical protein ACT4PT_02520 [Methanobacteriota archaeon]